MQRPSSRPLLHGAQWMCPGMLLAVTLQLVPPVITNPFVYELVWDRADARATFSLAELVTLGSQFLTP